MDGFGAADSYTDKEWEKVIGINLTVPTRLIRASIPLMKTNGGGSIVNICSKASISGAVSGVAYTAAKHGLVSRAGCHNVEYANCYIAWSNKKHRFPIP